MCSTIYLDAKIYTKRSLLNYEAANNFLESANEFYVDLYSKQRDYVSVNGWKSIYYDDHFHPNESGYDIIAQELKKTVARIWNSENMI